MRKKKELQIEGSGGESRITYPPKAEDVVVRCLKRPLKGGKREKNCKFTAEKSKKRRRYWLCG